MDRSFGAVDGTIESGTGSLGRTAVAYADAMSRCAEAGWSADGFKLVLDTLRELTGGRCTPSMAELEFVGGHVGVRDKARLGNFVESAEGSASVSGGGGSGNGRVGHASGCGGNHVLGVECCEPVVEPTVSETRGRNYFSNKRKREQRKKKRAMGEQWRRADGSGGCISDSSVSGTVMTVDSRTAEEIEAAKTLALRRVAENKVAVKLAEHKLRKLEDTTRTDVIERLAAARYEEQINGAKLRSQTSFKKCDDALKSLGSTGSAGEFALKQQIKDAQQSEAMLKYVQDQCDYYQKFASEEVRTHVRCMRPPKIIDAFEVFGDCPSEYDEDEATAYYADLQRQNDEAHEKFADWGQNDTLF